MDAAQISPVYIDGPLTGKDAPIWPGDVQHGRLAVYIRDGKAFRNDLDVLRDEPQAVYTFHEVVLFGRVVVVGTVREHGPDPTGLFAALTSGACKNAVIRHVPSQPEV